MIILAVGILCLAILVAYFTIDQYMRWRVCVEEAKKVYQLQLQDQFNGVKQRAWLRDSEGRIVCDEHGPLETLEDIEFLSEREIRDRLWEKGRITK